MHCDHCKASASHQWASGPCRVPESTASPLVLGEAEVMRPDMIMKRLGSCHPSCGFHSKSRPRSIIPVVMVRSPKSHSAGRFMHRSLLRQESLASTASSRQHNPKLGRPPVFSTELLKPCKVIINGKMDAANYSAYSGYAHLGAGTVQSLYLQS